MSRIEKIKENLSTEEENVSKIDFDALNKYMVKTVGIEEVEPVIGIISGIVFLGEQEQEDGKIEWNGTQEDEIEEINRNNTTYFEVDENMKKYKRWKTKPVKSVAITVDFPDIIVDKGKFFGNSNPAPLRICLNGQYWNKECQQMVLGRVYPLTLRKNEKTNNKWSLLPNNSLYKMAIGAKIIKQGDSFLPQDIVSLLGKSLQFNIKVFFNDKGFYTEYASFAAGLSRGQISPDYDENLLFYVDFNINNDPISIKYLTNPMINTMSLSPEWETSIVKQQIEEFRGNKKENELKSENVQEESLSNIYPEDIDDDSIPF